MESFFQKISLVALIIIFICAVFHKQKWAQRVQIINAGLFFIIHGIYEIVIVSETVNWLHNIWGIFQIVLALAFWGLFIKKNRIK